MSIIITLYENGNYSNYSYEMEVVTGALDQAAVNLSLEINAGD